MLIILLFISDLQISKYNVINIFQSKGLPRYLSLHQSHKYLVLENISYFLINHNLRFYLDITLVYLLFFTIPSILSRYSYFFTWFKQSKYPFKRVLVTVPILDMSLNFTGLHFFIASFYVGNMIREPFFFIWILFQVCQPKKLLFEQKNKFLATFHIYFSS